MTQLRLAVAGLRYRGMRSVLVAVLAVLATAVAVLGPGYARAAEQSVLRDTLRSAPSWQTGFSVQANGTAGKQESDAVVGGSANAPSSDALARIGAGYLAREAARTMLTGRYYRPGVAGVQTTVTPDVHDPDPTTGQLVYRDGFCTVLTPVQGRCPAKTGEVLASVRSRVKVGTQVPVKGRVSTGDGAPGSATVTVVGLYRPPGSTGGYWFNHGYFGEGVNVSPSGEFRTLDAFFGSEATVRSVGVSRYQTSADFRLRTDRVGLDDLPPLRARLAAGNQRLTAAGLHLEAPLVAAVLDPVTAERGQVALSALLVAVQLALLCFVVLFGVVRGATDERGPELALAKLRGLPGRQVAGFGLAEVGVLVLAAAPVGLAVGLLGTELVTRLALAGGVHAELRWPPVLAAAAACGGALVASVLAVRRTVVTPINDLLRRVPVRLGRWRAGMADGMLVIAAAAAGYQLLTGGAGPLGLLAGGLVALVAGVLAGRLVPLVLRLRLRNWLRRQRGGSSGRRVVRLLAAARLARGSAVARTVALVTVAVALLVYGAVAWNVAARNRDLRAATEVGAATVYDVSAPSVPGLLAAVDRADPSGHQAMAVARTIGGFGDSTTEVLAVDSTRLASVASWSSSFGATANAGSGSALDAAQVAARLAPRTAPSLALRGPTVTATVDTSSASADLALVALLVDANRAPHVAVLGQLRPGRTQLTGILAGCAAGCRLVGFDVYLGPDTPSRVAGKFTLTGLRDGDRALPAGFTATADWRSASPQFGQPVSHLDATRAGLTASFDSDSGQDLRILRADTPYPQPAAVVGKIGRGAGTFHAAGLYGLDQAYRPVVHAGGLPAITDGVLVDLRTADNVTVTGDSVTPPHYQVWAAPGAPAGLRARLAAAGLKITATRTAAADRQRLDRQGPALALRLYLIAAVAALLLAAGTVLMTAYLGARAQLHELAALRAAGVTGRLLRRAGLRENGLALGAALVAGSLAGGAGAALAVPRVPMFADRTGPPPVTWPDPWWPAGAVLAAALLLAAVVLVVVRTAVGRGTPDRLREGPA
jgi:putative ABC transport system permease protein